MKIIKLSIFFAALLLLGSCSKEGVDVPNLYDQIGKSEAFPTSVHLLVYVQPNGTKILEKGVLIGEDSTKLTTTVYDYDTTKHTRVDLLVRNLKPKTLYYFKPFIKTEKGVVTGKTCYKVTTLSAGLPVVNAGSFSMDGDYTATLRGVIISDGGAPIEEVGLVIGDKTYKMDLACLQGDTLKCILKDLNVSIWYKLYVKNKYGTGYSEEAQTNYEDKKVFYKNYQVTVSDGFVEGRCTFFGHGIALYGKTLVLSGKPMEIPKDDTIEYSPTDSGYYGCVYVRGSDFRGYGPTIILTDFTNASPNSTYYVRMVVNWYDKSGKCHYCWTDEATVVI